MKRFSIAEVRKNLSSIVDEVAQSNDAVLITRYGRPIARIVPFREHASPRARYPLRGEPITVAGDFDAPVSELWEALTAAEGAETYAAEGPEDRTTRTGATERLGRRRSKR